MDDTVADTVASVSTDAGAANEAGSGAGSTSLSAGNGARLAMVVAACVSIGMLMGGEAFAAFPVVLPGPRGITDCGIADRDIAACAIALGIGIAATLAELGGRPPEVWSREAGLPDGWMWCG